MQIPDPNGMELQAWANGVALAAQQYSSISHLSGEDWRGWGMMFFNNPTLDALNPPNPYFFEDWKEWGSRLSETLSNARGSQSKLVP
jgi:hypothetical protein